jgi:hypothetical protein
MQYYTFELNDEAKDLRTISTHFGLYEYLQVHMGVKQSQNISQEIIETLFHELSEVDVYVDDVGNFNTSWEEHLQSLAKVLQLLEDKNLMIKPLKCECIQLIG